MLGFTCVKRLSTQAEADIIIGLLESNNIKAVSSSDDFGGVGGPLTTGLGVKIWVEDQQVEEALEILGKS